MSHLILLTALALYAIGLILASWRFGVGLIQTLASGIVTIAFVWVAFYLVYVSDVLYAAGLAVTDRPNGATHDRRNGAI
jgi:hypothetical protein